MKYFLSIMLFVCSFNALAQPSTYIDGNGIRMYHTLFNSQMMDATAANALNLKRAPNVATLTISLSKPLGDGSFSLGQKGLIKAYALNILGQRTDFEFIPVDEGDVTYYLAQIRYSDRETLRVFILAGFENGARVSTEFNQQMYVEHD